MNIPENYEVIFVQGGATTQFDAVPLNLSVKRADYVITGNFAKSLQKRCNGDIRCGKQRGQNFTYIPKNIVFRTRLLCPHYDQ